MSQMEVHSQYMKSSIFNIGWFVLLRHISYPFNIQVRVVSPIETDNSLLKDFAYEHKLG